MDIGLLTAPSPNGLLAQRRNTVNKRKVKANVPHTCCNSDRVILTRWVEQNQARRSRSQATHQPQSQPYRLALAPETEPPGN